MKSLKTCRAAFADFGDSWSAAGTGARAATQQTATSSSRFIKCLRISKPDFFEKPGFLCQSRSFSFEQINRAGSVGRRQVFAVRRERQRSHFHVHRPAAQFLTGATVK